MKLKKALSVDNFLKMKIPVFEFTGEWLEAFGKPESRGFWIIWGDSSNGKTGFGLKLAKYLTRFGKVYYNSLEEAASVALQEAYKREAMTQVSGRLHLIYEGLEEIDMRIKNNNSAKIIIIDSLQYTGLSKRKFIEEFRYKYPNKLIIFISQGTAKEPDGAIGRAVKFEAKLKISVDRFIAYNNGRSQGTSNRFIIDAKKAMELN